MLQRKHTDARIHTHMCSLKYFCINYFLVDCIARQTQQSSTVATGSGGPTNCVCVCVFVELLANIWFMQTTRDCDKAQSPTDEAGVQIGCVSGLAGGLVGRLGGCLAGRTGRGRLAKGQLLQQVASGIIAREAPPPDAPKCYGNYKSWPCATKISRSFFWVGVVGLLGGLLRGRWVGWCVAWARLPARGCSLDAVYLQLLCVLFLR